ncbi:MAG TPA: hypothetical protein VLL97_00010 [Acidobacteriota bacterium]|nr:hypothetical protein [Acidobacteriota bacterium]
MFPEVARAGSSIESYPAQTTVDGITIAVDPHFSDEKSYAVFNVRDLNSRGYFPLRVIISNSTGKYLKLHTRNAFLITASKTNIYTVPAVMIEKDLFSQNLGGRKSRQEPPPNDFAARELVMQSIEPRSVVEGFLFFSLPETQKDYFRGSSLHIPGIEEEGTRKAFGPFIIELDPALSLSE